MEYSELVNCLSADPGVDHSISLAKVLVKDNDLFEIIMNLVKGEGNEEVIEKFVKAYRQQEESKIS